MFVTLWQTFRLSVEIIPQNFKGVVAQAIASVLHTFTKKLNGIFFFFFFFFFYFFFFFFFFFFFEVYIYLYQLIIIFINIIYFFARIQ